MPMDLSSAMRRRGFLRLAASSVAAVVGVPLSACGRTSPSDSALGSRPGDGRVLLAHFSRPGENYCSGGRRNLEVGNTEVLARMISDRLDCDVHRIEPADPYPDSYDATVARNVREQDAGARPEIATPLASIDRYETILLASPIWNVRAPMIMSTFAESYDFAGKTVVPVTTYAMSGLGTTEDDYARSCEGARIATGLAVRGEEVRSAGAAVDSWLRRARCSAVEPLARPEAYGTEGQRFESRARSRSLAELSGAAGDRSAGWATTPPRSPWIPTATCSATISGRT
jgi:flavodoxin